MNKNRKLTKTERTTVYEKYNKHCAYCGKEIEMKDMQVDHITPQWRYEGVRAIQSNVNDMDNLNPSCRRCNHYKRGDSLETFRQKLKTIHDRVRKIYICKVAEDYGIIKMVAFNSSTYDFVQGMYIKSNIIFTTRGCNNNCPWCIVPRQEGKLRELPIYQGNIIQDNNFLQASRQHKEKVFDMLRTQKGICFKGGLEPDLIDDHFVDNITSLRIKELWLACDTDGSIPMFKKACEKLAKAGFNRNKIYCYALSYGKDMEADEARCRQIWEAGAMPFMQLYRDFSDKKTQYSVEWNKFQRMWSRPAAINAHMKKGTEFKDYRT